MDNREQDPVKRVLREEARTALYVAALVAILLIYRYLT